MNEYENQCMKMGCLATGYELGSMEFHGLYIVFRACKDHEKFVRNLMKEEESVPKTRFKVENQSTNMYSNLHPGIRDLEPPIIQAPTQKKTIKKFLIKLDDRLSQEEVEKVNKGIAEHMFIAYNSNTIQEITTLEFEEE